MQIFPLQSHCLINSIIPLDVFTLCAIFTTNVTGVTIRPRGSVIFLQLILALMIIDYGMQGGLDAKDKEAACQPAVISPGGAGVLSKQHHTLRFNVE